MSDARRDKLAETLSAYVDGEVDERERTEVEALLRSDPDARALLDELRVLSSTLAEDEPPAMPPGIAAAIRTRLSDAPRRPSAWWRNRHVWTAAAAAVVVCAVIGVVVHNLPPEQRLLPEDAQKDIQEEVQQGAQEQVIVAAEPEAPPVADEKATQAESVKEAPGNEEITRRAAEPQARAPAQTLSTADDGAQKKAETPRREKAQRLELQDQATGAEDTGETAQAAAPPAAPREYTETFIFIGGTQRSSSARGKTWDKVIVMLESIRPRGSENPWTVEIELPTALRDELMPALVARAEALGGGALRLEEDGRPLLLALPGERWSKMERTLEELGVTVPDVPPPDDLAERCALLVLP